MTRFTMPKLGITMDEGTVSRWLVKEGDKVEAGDPIVMVETDKAEVEVTANESGVVLQIVVPEGGTVPVGETIAHIGQPGDVPSEPDAPPAAEAGAPTVGDAQDGAGTSADSGAAPSAPAAAVAPSRAVGPGQPKRRISPRARRMAQVHNLDLTDVQGTGPLGRIIARDVQALLDRLPAEAPAAVATTTGAPAPGLAPPPPGRVERLSRMRRVIAERMTYSVQTIPTFRLTMAADISATNQLRNTLVDLVSRSGVRLTLTDFLIQAVAQALREHPAVNASFVPGSSWADSAISYADAVNVGLAVAVPQGLVVPVLADADRLSLVEIAGRRAELIEGARNGSLRPEQMSGGTFTISNLGAYGVEQFDAIINPPEAAILAVGRARPEYVPTEDGFETRTVMNLTMTCDHRVLDGAGGAEFLAAVVRRLEKADEYVLA